MSNVQEIAIDIGIEPTDRQEIARGLEHVLADSYTLYLKTQNVYWNVTGPMFRTLHLMFEEHYIELALAVDLIAERIRALGGFAPASFAAYIRLGSVVESESVPPADEIGRSRAGCALGPRRVWDRRCRQRPVDSRHADPAPGAVRKDGLDAAQPDRDTRLSVGGSGASAGPNARGRDWPSHATPIGGTPRQHADPADAGGPTADLGGPDADRI